MNERTVQVLTIVRMHLSRFGMEYKYVIAYSGLGQVLILCIDRSLTKKRNSPSIAGNSVAPSEAAN